MQPEFLNRYQTNTDEINFILMCSQKIVVNIKNIDYVIVPL